MAYIGAQPNKQLTETTSQSFNGTGSATAFTLNRAVNTGEELEVFVDNVQQEPGSGKSYTATGTTLTFDEASPSGTGNVYVIYRGQAEVTTRLEAPDLSITTAKIVDANVTDAKIDTMAATKLTGTISNSRFPTGSIIQVKYLQYTGTTSTAVANASNQTLDHLNVSITPIATNSIIRLDAMVNGEWSSQLSSYNSTWFFYRGATKLSHAAAGNRQVGILMGTALTYESSDSSSTPEQANYSYFDTPSTTSQVTYTVAVSQKIGSTSTWYTNRTVSDTDTYDFERGISFISATEIAG